MAGSGFAMASKKFKNKICVYCGSTDRATEREDVIARSFVLAGREVNAWPTVPACRECNKKKSDLERYIATATLLGGRHPDSHQILESSGPRRLAKNARLKMLMRNSLSPAWDIEGSVWVRTSAVAFDWSKIEKLSALIATGLASYHWETRLFDGCFVKVHRPMRGRLADTIRALASMRGNKVGNDIGAGTFVYKGTQSIEHPQVTAWEFSFFGGLRAPGDTSSSARIGILTGPDRIRAKSELSSRWRHGERLHG